MGMAALLILIFVGQAASSLRQKSLTADEGMYITAGYYHLQEGTFRFNMTNPPLVKVLAALPLLALDPELPEVEGDPAAWSSVEQWRYSRRFLYENRRPARHILMTARAPFLLLGAFTGWLVFVWARRLYGDAGGVLALAVYVLCPAVLGHAPLANQDFGVGALSLIALYALWCASERETPARVTAAGAALGAALLTKFTAVALLRPEEEPFYSPVIQERAWTSPIWYEPASEN